MVGIEEITKNLFGFYRLISRFPGYESGYTEDISWVRAKDGGWPGFILGGDFISAEKMSRLTKAIERDELPPLWIRLEEAGSDFEELAWENGIRKINYWKGMAVDYAETSRIGSANHTAEVSRLTHAEEMKDWLEVVNTEIIPGRRIVNDSFRDLLKAEELSFWQIKEKGSIVSTLLSFKDESVVGIYLVATSSAFRRQGFATILLKDVIAHFTSMGNTRFVLHSTPLGYDLYRKTGFEERCEYGIYWKLEKR